MKDSYLSADEPFSSRIYSTKLKYQNAFKRLMPFISSVILDVSKTKSTKSF